ncbi:MAG: metalloregulator ArsR/SmtB family transcription factor [Chitinophagales bacterium]
MKTTRDISVPKIQKIAEVLKTIGHPLRLKILEILEQEEPLCVSDIKERLPITAEQSLLSHHLIKMKDKGVLNSEKRGMHVYYSIHDRQILNIFNCLENCSI